MVDKPTVGKIEFSPLIVTRGDGVPLPDQVAAVEEFKRQCLRSQDIPNPEPQAEIIKSQAAELAALRAELHQTRSDRQREHDLRCRLAGEAEALRARVAELQRDLMYAEDAAQKGRLARENAAGMELRIAELEGKITATIMWLEREQPDVFRRGLWDAIGATESAGNVDLTKE
jgi:hypothetical protein